MRHTRAVQRDRTKRPLSAPSDEQLTARLTEVIHPATLDLVRYYHQLGLRERLLTLPVMVALVLSLIWRQFSGVSEVVRVIRTDTRLWVPPLQKLSQQALDQRLRTLPAVLFLRLLCHLLPVFQSRWQARQRPVPAVIAWAHPSYSRLLICDGSTLDALIRKVGLLRELTTHPLAGRMTALLDLATRLPWKLWYEPDPNANDQRGWPQLLAALPAGALLLFDLGYTNFTVFLQLTQARVTFITRAKSNLAYQLETALQRRDPVHDLLVWIGRGADRQPVRLIEVLYHGVWYRYLTNELDPQRLPVEYVVAEFGKLFWPISALSFGPPDQGNHHQVSR
ncbi:MAG: transposase [Candidatus Competibacteraceae bacterium]